MEKKSAAQENDNSLNVGNGRVILTFSDLVAKLVKTTDVVQDELNDLHEVIQCLSVIDPTRKDFCFEMNRYLEEMNLSMDELYYAVGQYEEESR